MTIAQWMTPKPMLTVREVATAFGMSEAWARKGCRDGSIPAIRVGRKGSWRIARAWVERVLEGKVDDDRSV